MYIVEADCCAHSACHRLQRAIEKHFEGSHLSEIEHDAHGSSCVIAGQILFNGSVCDISFSQIDQRQIRLAVNLAKSNAQRLLKSIHAAYSSELDAVGARHALDIIHCTLGIYSR